MAIIGELIKKAIDFTGMIISDPDPVEAQKKVLKKLLARELLNAPDDSRQTGIGEVDLVLFAAFASEGEMEDAAFD